MSTLFVGTSGFAYKEWKPEFYPPDLKAADMLAFYAQRLPSVEINNTFYRMPTEATLAAWREQTPPGFRFTLKAPQRITHIKRLRTDDDSLEHFVRVARTLGDRLGAVLFQLPSTMRYDADRLGSFVAALPGEPFRFAMEFRHPSWDDPQVRAALRDSGVAWCVADTDEADAPMIRTAAGFVYLRLRKVHYDEEQLSAWATAARAAMDDGADVYAYFKHEDDPSGVRFGLRFAELVAA